MDIFVFIMPSHREVELRAINALMRPVQARPHEILRYAISTNAFLFFGLAIVAFTTFDELNLHPDLTWAECLLIWTISVLVQVGAYIALACGWAVLQARFRFGTIYLPLIGLAAYLLNFVVTTENIRLLSETWVPQSTWLHTFVTGYVLCLVFETLFFAFVLPAELLPPGNGTTQRQITIAGECVAVDDIRYIQSSEHYVQIALLNDTLRLRARIGDVVSQLDEADGVLAHRSHWIARRAFADLRHENGGDVILTTKGERFAVARPRRDTVLTWIDTYIA